MKRSVEDVRTFLRSFAEQAGLEEPTDDETTLFHLFVDLIEFADAQSPRLDIRLTLDEAVQHLAECEGRAL